jgi:hypothetical protein
VIALANQERARRIMKTLHVGNALRKDLTLSSSILGRGWPPFVHLIYASTKLLYLLLPLTQPRCSAAGCVLERQILKQVFT